MKPARVLIALLALALLVWMASLWMGTGGGPAPSAEDAAAGAGSGGTEAPRLLGAQGGSRGPATELHEEDSAPEGGRAADDAARVTHFIEGHIKGLSKEAAAHTHVEIHLVGDYDWTGNRVAEGAADASGHFRLDLGAMREKYPQDLRVQVIVDHAAHVVLKRIVELAPLAAGRTLLQEPFALKPAYCVPVVVQDEDGQAICSASVYLIAMQGGEPRERGRGEVLVFDTGSTDESGRWDLRAPVAGPVLLLAGADGHLSRGVLLALDERTPPPAPIVLPRGAVISGQVFLNGAPAEGASVRALQVKRGRDLFLWDINARWHEGQIVSGQVGGATDEQGRYELTGLLPGPVRVSVVGYGEIRLWEGRRDGEVDEFIRGDIRRETPPAAGVDFDLRAPMFSVRVLSEGEPVAAAQVQVGQDDLGWAGTTTDQDGFARFLVAPGRAFELKASPERHPETKAEIQPMGKSETRTHVLELGPRRPEATLLVELKDAEGRPITRAGFQVMPKQDVDGFFDEALPSKHQGQGIHRLENLPVGEQVLIVFPNRSPGDWHGLYLNVHKTVQLEADRELRVQVTATLGTRLFVTVRNETGAILPARASLLDGRGQSVQAVYCWSDEDSSSSSNAGLGPVRTTVEPPLAPGSYVLVISESGYETQRVAFVLDREPEKDLVVTLRKQ